MSRKKATSNGEASDTTCTVEDDVNPFAPWTAQDVIEHHAAAASRVERLEREFTAVTSGVFSEVPHPLDIEDVTDVRVQWDTVEAHACGTHTVSFRVKRSSNAGSTLCVQLPGGRAWIPVGSIDSQDPGDVKRALERWWRGLVRGRVLPANRFRSGSWRLTAIRVPSSDRKPFMGLKDGHEVAILGQVSYSFSIFHQSATRIHKRLESARESLATAVLQLSVVDVQPNPCDAFVDLLLTLHDSELPVADTLIPPRCLWELARSGRPSLVGIALKNPATDTESLSLLLTDTDPEVRRWALYRVVSRLGSPYTKLWDPVSQSHAMVAAMVSSDVRDMLDFGDPLLVDGILCDPVSGKVFSL